MIMPEFGFGALEQEFWDMAFLMIRTGAALFAAPLFGASSVPVQVRIVMAGALAVMIANWMPVESPPMVVSFAMVLTVMQEIIIGLAMGFVLQVAFAAPMIGAEIVSGTMGMAIATAIDPNSGTQSSALGQFYGVVLTLIFVALGGHLLWLRLVIESYALLPPAGGIAAAEVGWQIASFAAQVFATALAIALPVTLILLVVQMMTGVLSRSAPSLNLFALGLPSGVLAGLAALIAAMPVLQEQLITLSSMMIEEVGAVAQTAAGGTANG